MNHMPPNRMAQPETRKQGRPPASQPPQPEQLADPEVADDGVSVSVKCPDCGRKQTLVILRRRLSDERDCLCSCNPVGFTYRPGVCRSKRNC